MTIQSYIFYGLLVAAIVVLAIASTQESAVKGGVKRVERGPLGDAKFADWKKEVTKQYKQIHFDLDTWRKDPSKRPTHPGLLMGNEHRHVKHKNKKRPFYIDKKGNYTGGDCLTYVNEGDYNAMVLASSGSGKTSFWLAANCIYNAACGCSMVITDTKGDNYKNLARIFKEDFGYNIISYDLAKPLQSSRWNIMAMINKYVDLYNGCLDKKSEQATAYLTKAFAYAKIVSETIIKNGADSSVYSGNAYFYDSAEGILTSCLLIVSMYSDNKSERHIFSVYKLIQELSGVNVDPITQEKTSKIQEVLDELGEDDMIRFLAGPAAMSSPDSSASVVSTALSRILQFLDPEIAAMICSEESDLDAESFVGEKTVVFITMPEENKTRFFIPSLLISTLYGELVEISREYGNRIPSPKGFPQETEARAYFFIDEMGQLPKISGHAEAMSTCRSRNIFFVNIIQNLTQLENKYGKAQSSIIIDNTKLVFVSGIAALSQDANTISRALGKYTIETNSVSNSSRNGVSSNSSTRSKQMTAIDLMNPEEVRNKLGLGKMLIIRSGENPILSNYDLYLDWNIRYREPLETSSRRADDIKYVSKVEIIKNIRKARNETDTIDISNDNDEARRLEEESRVEKEQEEKEKAEREVQEALSGPTTLNITPVEEQEETLEQVESNSEKNPFDSETGELLGLEDETPTGEQLPEEDIWNGLEQDSLETNLNDDYDDLDAAMAITAFVTGGFSKTVDMKDIEEQQSDIDFEEDV